MAKEENFCGCCGRKHRNDNLYWCEDCAEHVLKSNAPPYERTWFAQFAEKCPYAGVGDYEDQLPSTMTDAQYDAWYAESWIEDGVRVGPTWITL
jgi:predicted amidophosphoribosyltransferase